MRVQDGISIALVSFICGGVDSFRLAFNHVARGNQVASSSSRHFQLHAVTDVRIDVDSPKVTKVQVQPEIIPTATKHASPLMANTRENNTSITSSTARL